MGRTRPVLSYRFADKGMKRISVSVIRYKKGRPSSGPVREDSVGQLFNVEALNTEGGVQ